MSNAMTPMGATFRAERFLAAEGGSGDAVLVAVAALALGRYRALKAATARMSGEQRERFEGLGLDDSPKQAMRAFERSVQ